MVHYKPFNKSMSNSPVFKSNIISFKHKSCEIYPYEKVWLLSLDMQNNLILPKRKIKIYKNVLAH